MTSSADDKKRWAILPPPTAEAAALSEDFQIDPRAGLVRDGLSAGRNRSKEPSSRPRPKTSSQALNPPKTAPERRAEELRQRYEAFEAARKMSSIQALEPSDSGVPTERPEPVSERSPLAPAHRRPDQETIPAPDWDDDSSY